MKPRILYAVALAASLLGSGAVGSARAAGDSPPPAADPTGAAPDREAAFRALATAGDIAQGSGTRVLYVFVDPNCPYCRRTFDDLQPLIAREHLQVRWVVVGILTPTSPGKAAAILGAKHPLAALRYNERHFHYPGGGGIEEDLPSDATARRLHHNRELMEMTGANSVPTLIFRARGGRPMMVQGAPDAAVWKALLRELR